MTLEELQQAARDALVEITAAGSKEALEQARVKFLGRKGLITQALRSLGSLPVDLRPQFGQEANRLKTHFLAEFRSLKPFLNGWCYS